MRIILDTNVLIATFIARGACAKLFEHCIIIHTLITSEFILSEVTGKLAQKFKFSDERIIQVSELLRSRCYIIELEQRVCRDPDDDNILAAALAGECVCIITGDKDLLVLENFAGINIVSPNEFAEFESRFV